MSGYIKVTTLIWLLTGILSSGFASTDTDSTLNAVDQSIRMRQYEKAVKQLTPLLRQNNATAQYLMAGLYRAGKGVEQDQLKASELYEKAAMSGLAEAQYAYAGLLEKLQPGSDQVRLWYQAAADQGYARAIKKLKSIKIDSSKMADNDAIFNAIRHNHINTIEKMLAKGMSTNILDSNQQSPLLVALNSGHKDMASLLIDYSRLLDKADKGQNRPLHIATRQGYKDVVEKLISRGVDIDAQDILGNTALMIAVNNNHRQLIDIFLKHKADPNIKNKKHLSAIDLARNRKNLGQFENAGIDTTESTKKPAAIDVKAFEKTVRSSTSLYSGWPILSIASHLGEESLVQQLIARNTNVNAADPAGFTALHRAAASGQLAIVKKLVDKGATVNATNKRRETPLFLAAAAGHIKTLQFLLQNSAKTASLTNNKNSALSVAIRNHHKKTANLLVNKPLDQKSRHRALLIAIENKMESVAIKLSNNSALLSKADDKQRTVLWLAANAGLKHLVATLLKDSKVVKNIDQKDKLGYTALARATLGNHRSIVKILIDRGASTRTVTQEENTLLMLAAISGHAKLVEYYMRTGIDLNHTDRAGYTAIMLAAAKGNVKIVDLLLSAGADLQRHNHDNQNAYQIALEAGHEKTANLIKSRSGTLFNLFN